MSAISSPISPLTGPAVPADGVHAGSPDRYAVLDDEPEWSAFSRALPQQPGCWESTLLIEGMHCAACAGTVEDALSGVVGVLQAEVSAGSRRARVVWRSSATRPSDWMRAVQASGYRAVPANDVFARERRLQESRRALWRLLVAGLCMMQVMMYAYPAYVAAPGDLSAESERLLRWASWVLSLPVILFSCGPFFRNAWRDLRQRSISMDLPVALGMLITFAVSSAGTFDPQGLFGREVYFDSFTMFVFFLLAGRWLELRLRDRTAGALEALMNRLPDSVARLDARGRIERVPVRRLRAGDLIEVVPGEAFAADGVVESGETRVDEALMTGESWPVARGPGSAVIAGSHNLAATVRVRVQRAGLDTRFAAMVALMERAATARPQLARLADRLARPFLVAVLLAALGACAWWWQEDPAHALMVAVAVLVVTCPCALSLATPAAMLASAGALARRGIWLRRLDALEALAGVDTVLFDKTGTLTHDRLQVVGVRARDGLSEPQALALAGALAGHSLHPVSRALAQAAAQAGGPAPRVDDVAETRGAGLQGMWRRSGTHGPAGGWLRLGSAAFCGLDRSQAGAPGAAPQGRVHLADESGWLASFDLEEDVRDDARAAVQALQAAGLRVWLVSGDQPDAVARVAAAVGIRDVAAACTPEDKLALLHTQQRAGHRVAVVGDGLNDGPVIAGADASYAFGQAVPLAQAQADFVVLGGQLNAVPLSLLLARRTLTVVRQNLAWAALYNAVCVPLAVAGWLGAWLAGLGMAASSLGVVLNALRLSQGPRSTRLDPTAT
ncbi:MAG: cation-translocating P-type ATPase [Rhodoferax sp.]|nr:cation-translocating P-type ATPase [Rhodoferax sp.]